VRENQTGFNNKLSPSETVILNIAGMTCASCVKRVSRTLLKEPGVLDVRVSLKPPKAKVLFDPNRTNPGRILKSRAFTETFRGMGDHGEVWLHKYSAKVLRHMGSGSQHEGGNMENGRGR